MSGRMRSVSASVLAFRHKVRYLDDGCWEWTGKLTHGYGRLSWQGRMERAHRVAYRMAKGPIPDGLVLDHLCRRRNCVNPAHLEPVTIGQNVQRGANSLKTHCPQGHPYSGDNLRARQYADQFARMCRACDRERARQKREALR